MGNFNFVCYKSMIPDGKVNSVRKNELLRHVNINFQLTHIQYGSFCKLVIMTRIVR